MDADKRRLLVDIEYTIKPCCGMCRFARLSFDSDWGTCTAHRYTHQKHSDSDREMSIHRLGSCERFQVAETSLPALGAFAEFFTPPA